MPNPADHEIAIAKKTLRMPDAMLGVMGGMSKADARQILSAEAGWSDAKIARFETA
jgi:hypothetical protein